MAYTAPTVSHFKARFSPVFDAVGDSPIQGALGRAARMVDESWTEGDFAEARMLFAAHDLTTEGVGATADAANVLAGGALKARAEGDHKIEFASTNGPAIAAYAWAGPFATTIYGRKFADLLRVNRGGARVAASIPGAYSASATDWPIF